MSQRTDHMTRIYEDVRQFLSPLYVGIDSILEDATHAFHSVTGYPPYNIVKQDEETLIEVALAGISSKEINYGMNLTVFVENNILHIKYVQPVADIQSEGARTFDHKGIASRSFDLTFPIVQGLVVNSAKMVNGLLTVRCVKVPPLESVRNYIAISTE